MVLRHMNRSVREELAADERLQRDGRRTERLWANCREDLQHVKVAGLWNARCVTEIVPPEPDVSFAHVKSMDVCSWRLEEDCDSMAL